MLELSDRVDWLRNSRGTATLNGRTVRFGCGPNGAADLLGIVRGEGADSRNRGRFIAVECKSATGHATPDQLLFLDRIRRSGGIAVLARSVDDVIAALAGG